MLRNDSRGRLQSRLSTLARYYHTARHLRPIQVAARAWFKVQRPRPDARAAPALRSARGPLLPGPERAPMLLAPDLFRFLNLQRRCVSAADWQPADVSKLWVYNLHYFDDLNARDAPLRRDWHAALLERWVRENPPGPGDAWEPYPLSRRIVNWVQWSLRGQELPPACWQSLAVQARWLSRRLEYHLLGNHLLVNAKALMHAGLYFAGPEAERWYARGHDLLARQLPEQVLADGGHFERSPMYHAAALEDLLDLVNLLQAYGREPPAPWCAAVTSMRRWLGVMTHPDGEIAFFNDAAFDIAARPSELEAYALRLGLGAMPAAPEALVVLQPSGYVRGRNDAAYLVCDCAPVGPDYLPAHAHADTLSFELSLYGRRLLVNSGTSQYATDRERQRQRGTAAHNTVLVDGADSSEVWAGFRVARRARAHLALARVGAQELEIAASHDGYRRLPGRNQHQRHWRLEAQALSIEDHVSGAFASARAHMHLHPQFSARAVAADAVLLNGPDGIQARLLIEGAAHVEVAPSTWHPRFGVREANLCVIAHLGGPTLRTRLTWQGAP